SEIIPKTLGAVHASRLVRFVSTTLRLMVWTMTPLLILTRGITGALTHGERKGVSRGELAAMVALARQEGELHDQHSKVLSNALRFHEVRLEDVMTPRTVVAMLPHDGTLVDLLEGEAHRPFSRLPLFRDGDRDQVTGYVLQRQLLYAAAGGADPSTPLADFAREALFLPETTPVDRAMRTLIEKREHLAFVSDEYGGISGLVTLEDLLETLLGVEILDESDQVADLRAEAVRLRQRRLVERGLDEAAAPPKTGSSTNPSS
ncbi:MAG: CBS domain-containing protein, partial [Acidobacteriota bacterium]